MEEPESGHRRLGAQLREPPIRIRRMETGDIPSVVAIETKAFSTPWEAESFHFLIGRPGSELWVCTSDGGEILAYAVVALVLDQAELANIAVREDVRGQRIGSTFLDFLLELVAERGTRELFLEVRESNTVARSLYRARGFQEIGRRKDYYNAPREDALQLVKRFPEPAR